MLPTSALEVLTACSAVIYASDLTCMGYEISSTVLVASLIQVFIPGVDGFCRRKSRIILNTVVLPVWCRPNI